MANLIAQPPSKGKEVDELAAVVVALHGAPEELFLYYLQEEIELVLILKNLYFEIFMLFCLYENNWCYYYFILTISQKITKNQKQTK